MGDANIAHWAFPPPRVHKPELTPHTAVFLTTDRALALRAGTRIYSAKISPGANVIDLRQPSAESEQFRLAVVQEKYGRDHFYATKDHWTSAWQQGQMMRFASDKPDRLKETDRIMEAKRAIDWGDRSLQNFELLLLGQNLTREWIEEIVSVGRDLGYDAIIGREPDSYRSGGAVVCEVLIALNSQAITTPVLVR